MVNVSYKNLARGEVKSCGCLQKETMSKNIEKATVKRNEFRIDNTDIMLNKPYLMIFQNGITMNLNQKKPRFMI